MIRSLAERLLGRSGSGSKNPGGGGPGPGSGSGGESVESLRSEVRRLEEQNERLRRAMRHCIDCEYRIESIDRRNAEGANADGSPGK